jgi:hypothetical protein
MMTTEQEERLLGQLCKGVSTDAALEDLGLSRADLTDRLDSDSAFRLAYYLAQQVRDGFAEQMERLQK